MKKVLSVLMISIIVVVSLGLPVHAMSNQKVFDDYGSAFYSNEIEDLQEKLDIFANTYGIGLYFMVVSDESELAGRTTEEYAADMVGAQQLDLQTADSLSVVIDFASNRILFYTTGNGAEIFTSETTNAITTDINAIVSGSYFPAFDAAISRAAADATAYTGKETPAGIVSIDGSSGEYPTIVDSADMFTPEEEAQLQARIDELIAEYNFYYTVLTVTDTSGYYDLVEYADDFRGLDDNADGVVFARNPETREYATSARGYGLTVFTWPDAFDRIDDIVVPYLKEDETFEAYMAHIDFTEEALELAYSGEAYTSPWYAKIDGTVVVLSVGTGVLASIILAFIITGSWISAMKTAVKQTHARNYVRSGSFRLFDNRDIFITEHTTKTRKSSSSGGGGGGGGSNSFGGSRSSRGGRA